MIQSTITSGDTVVVTHIYLVDVGLNLRINDIGKVIVDNQEPISEYWLIHFKRLDLDVVMFRDRIEKISLDNISPEVYEILSV